MAQGCRWRSFLCLFAQEHPDFRLQELLSLASLAKCELQYDPKTYSDKHPFLVIQLQSEKYARHIMSRSLLMRSMFELWGWGRDYQELEASVKEFPPDLMVSRYEQIIHISLIWRLLSALVLYLTFRSHLQSQAIPSK